MNCDGNVRMVILDHEFLLQGVHIDDQQGVSCSFCSLQVYYLGREKHCKAAGDALLSSLVMRSLPHEAKFNAEAWKKTTRAVLVRGPHTPHPPSRTEPSGTCKLCSYSPTLRNFTWRSPCILSIIYAVQQSNVDHMAWWSSYATP